MVCSFTNGIVGHFAFWLFKLTVISARQGIPLQPPFSFWGSVLAEVQVKHSAVVPRPEHGNS